MADDMKEWGFAFHFSRSEGSFNR